MRDGTGPALPQEVVRVLAVSDVTDQLLLAGLSAVATAQLILACGDLPFDYLGYLMDALDVPLVFVPGNHDRDLSGYRTSRAGLTVRYGLPARPPWPSGAVNADGRVVDVAGLRVAGLGGCLRYSGGPNQYSDRQQARRARALRATAWWHRRRDRRGVDVLLTHAPPLGVGDSADPAHRGFSAYHGLVAALQPAVLLHGHVHPVVPVPSRGRIGGSHASPDSPVSNDSNDHNTSAGSHSSSAGAAGQGALLGRTVVRNVAGRHLLDIELPDPAGGERDAG
jgi:calcineurin-like phosphoesterase family protein